MIWRKSSFSGNGGECVEVAWPERGVRVRDSKNVGGPRVEFPEVGWRALLANLRG